MVHLRDVGTETDMRTKHAGHLVFSKHWPATGHIVTSYFIYVIKEILVHILAYSMELWMQLGSWESSQKSRVAHGHRLKQLLRFYDALPKSHLHT